MSAGGHLAALGGRELMRTSAPLLGDVGEGGPTVRDLHAMARMVHTGVPLADCRLHLRYEPCPRRWCGVWCYVWSRLGIDGPAGGEPMPSGDDVRVRDLSCPPR